jgi:TPR repeat protein
MLGNLNSGKPKFRILGDRLLGHDESLGLSFCLFSSEKTQMPMFNRFHSGLFLDGAARFAIVLSEGRPANIVAGDATGFDIAVDLGSSINYYQPYIDPYNPSVQFEYARLLAAGDGVPMDLSLPAKCYKLAADQNHANAQNSNAACLEKGQGVSIDLVLAARSYKLAADQNCFPVQNNYALYLQYGRGVPVDLVLAARYYKLAADQNDALGQFNYAVCLTKGACVPIDLVLQPSISPSSDRCRSTGGSI